jgi:hypothetical protein
MSEQRPPTSPAPHPAAGQPQRLNPVQQGPQALRTNQTLQGSLRPVARSAPPSTASLPMDDDDLLVLDDVVTLEDDAQLTPPNTSVPTGAAPAARAAVATEAPAPKKITFGAENTIRQHHWKRKPHLGGQGACRVKTFHGKLSDQGLEYLDDAINVFLDEHPDIEVKFVQSNVGMFDGKFKDFALIVNVWY